MKHVWRSLYQDGNLRGCGRLILVILLNIIQFAVHLSRHLVAVCSAYYGTLTIVLRRSILCLMFKTPPWIVWNPVNNNR